MNYVKDLKWKYDVLTSDPTSEDWGTGFTQLGTGAAAHVHRRQRRRFPADL